MYGKIASHPHVEVELIKVAHELCSICYPLFSAGAPHAAKKREITSDARIMYNPFTALLPPSTFPLMVETC